MEELVSITVSLGAALSSGLVGYLATWLQRRRQGDREEFQEVTIERRLEQLGETARESARLIAEVEAEIEARAARADSLRREVEDAERLAGLAEEERQAVARLVRAEIGAESRRSFRTGIAINLLFFLAGVLASVAVALLIQPL